MKLTLSNENVYRLAAGMAELIMKREQEEGSKPGQEAPDMLLINALLDLSAKLTGEGGYALVQIIPFPLPSIYDETDNEPDIRPTPN